MGAELTQQPEGDSPHQPPGVPHGGSASAACLGAVVYRAEYSSWCWRAVARLENNGATFRKV